MKLTDLFIKRPVLAMVVNLVILIAGLQSIRSLSVRQFPRSDLANVVVTTVYVGANADLVRGFITAPLERVIAGADGIDFLESSSAQGVSTITVHLKLNYDTNAALTQIQSKVAQVRNQLPPEAEAPIIQLQTSDSNFAAAYLGFASKDLDQNQITDYLTRVVQPKLSAIPGVQRADIFGDRTFAMRVWLKPDKMAALGISPSQVRDALAANNYLSALGRTKGSMTSVNLVANTNLQTAEEFKQLVVKQENGVVVRLGDIADVVLGAETYDAEVRFNNQTAVFIGIFVLPTANTLDVMLMLSFGFTINLLTLLAIVLSVGLVVDDAIVMVENIERHLHMGKTPYEAAIDAARELVTPIIAMTITLAAVYTPVALQGGLTGSLFREFALTLAGAVIISGIVALTLSPMMGSKLLRAEHVDEGFSGLVNRTFDRFRNWYGEHLDRTLNARPAVYIFWAGISLLAVLMFTTIPKLGTKELAPKEDQGVIFGIITAPANETIDDTIRYADAAGKVFQDIPDTRFTFQITSPSSGFGGMVLKPWGTRKVPTKNYLPVVQEQLGAIHGIQMFPIM